ncbi:hypothetical protein NKDENANG_02934 [Candidatus Entotheonellaceae bacterium PAL068K]
MRFNRRCRGILLFPLAALVALGIGLLPGCDANLPSQDEVFQDAAQRVEDTLLPPLVDESEAVLRNLVNLLTALPEICATPLASLGVFTSSLPALGKPSVTTFNDSDGTWDLTWRDAVLGDDDGQFTGDTTTPPIDVTLNVRFRSQNGLTLRAVPFTLVNPDTTQTVGTPTLACITTACFFLYQDAATGVWTLRWLTQEGTQVFAGTLSIPTGVTRVIKRVEAGENNEVTSLTVNTSSTSISFEETTTPENNKGFTFFVRPGERIRFQLRLGPEGSEPQNVMRNQVLLGAEAQPLSPAQEPDTFDLASHVPFDPRGAPAFTPGAEVGSFIWQDTETNDCDAATEDQWRLRFSAQDDVIIYSGRVRGIDLEDDGVPLRVTAVSSCPAGSLSNNNSVLEYDCSLQQDAEGGYDICLSRGQRPNFSPEINEVRDSGLVFIGAARLPPPSPDPFSILFDIELLEQGSTRNLEFSDAFVVLRGNNDEEGTVPLNPEQESLDPLCSIVEEQGQPRVRLTNEGDYSTERLEGSLYRLEDVEFTDTGVASLQDIRRFPDRGEILLETRVENEDADVSLLTRNISATQGDAVTGLIDVEISASEVVFTFANQAVALAVE